MRAFRSILFVGLLLSQLCAGAPGAYASVRFAAFGDYGVNNSNEQAVADLVHSWFPDFIITTGDNSYGETPIDDNVGQYYSSFIGDYAGAYGPGASTNHFFPSLGNHDIFNGGGVPAYEAYFTLPGAGIPSSNTSGNERYYDFVQGPVHFFAINSDNSEPDNNGSTSVPALWLKAQLAASTAPWKIVFFHHSPYSSAFHGNNPTMQWPFEEWGASAVLTGHDHVYERILKDGFPYFITGAGGNGLYTFNTPEPGSVVRFNDAHGSMLIEADADSLVFQFYSVQGGAAGTMIDSFTLHTPTRPLVEATVVPFGATWKYLDDGSDQGTAWRETAFSDSAWAAGAAELGYGDGGEATVIDCSPVAPACNAGNNYITSYFRHSFSVPDPSAYVDLSLTILRDDGAVVYLNGTEVLRSNMPPDSITATTLAATPLGGTLETILVNAIVPTTDLLTGTNVVAVEIHQSSQTSSDVSFDLQLDGLSTPPPVMAGDVIIAGLQTWDTPTGQSPGEFVELFNTTADTISLANMDLIARVDDINGGGVGIDWRLSDESPNLNAAVIAPHRFFLIAESGVAGDNGVRDLEVNVDLTTDEGGASERAVSLQLVVDGVHMDYVLYGRHDGTDLPQDIPPGDLPFDGVAFPRDEVIRNTTGTPSFSEGLVRRVSPAALYTGHAVAGFYSDDIVPPDSTAGVWFSPHDSTFGAYVARSSQTTLVTEPLTAELQAFTVRTANTDTVVVDWATASEWQNSGFEVQRAENLPTGFASLPQSFVAGHGTTMEPQLYSFVDVVPNAGTWFYRLKQIRFDCAISYSAAVLLDDPTDTQDLLQYSLVQNTPNPFNPQTLIRFSIPNKTHATLTMYDARGRPVATLARGTYVRGWYHVVWNARDMASGVYFYRLQTGDFTSTRKAVLLR